MTFFSMHPVEFALEPIDSIPLKTGMTDLFNAPLTAQ